MNVKCGSRVQAKHEGISHENILKIGAGIGHWQLSGRLSEVGAKCLRFLHWIINQFPFWKCSHRAACPSLLRKHSLLLAYRDHVLCP